MATIIRCPKCGGNRFVDDFGTAKEHKQEHRELTGQTINDLYLAAVEEEKKLFMMHVMGKTCSRR